MYNKIFTPPGIPLGEKIVAITQWRGRFFVATTEAIYELCESTVVDGLIENKKLSFLPTDNLEAKAESITEV